MGRVPQVACAERDRALASVRFRPISPATNQNATATCSSTTYRLTIVSSSGQVDGPTS